MDSSNALVYNIQSHKHLPIREMLPISHGSTIAIVGHSPSLLDSEYGELIDSHDFVVRLNDFRISGYEKCVGTKTNVWVGYCRPPEDCDVYLWHDIIQHPRGFRRDTEKKVRGVLSKAVYAAAETGKHNIFRTHGFLGLFMNGLGLRLVFEKYHGKEARTPCCRITTGMFAILCFSLLTPILDKPISVFGCDPSHFKNRTIDHYFGKKSQDSDNGIKCHNSLIENAILQLLVDNGSVRLLSTPKSTVLDNI